MKNNLEKSLKRFLKRKVKITIGIVVAFMITGNIGYSEIIWVGRTEENKNYTNKEQVIELDDIYLSETIKDEKRVEIGDANTASVSIRNFDIGISGPIQNSISEIQGNTVSIDNIGITWDTSDSNTTKNNTLSINADTFINSGYFDMGRGKKNNVTIVGNRQITLGDVYFGQKKTTYTEDESSDNKLNISSDSGDITINSIGIGGNKNIFNIIGNNNVTINNGIS